MAQRRSVLEPKPTVIHADDRTLVPRLNWGSARTWGVFAGWALLLGAISSLTSLLCWLAATHLIENAIVRALAAALAALILLMLAATALERAIPLRDTSGEIVAVKPRLNFGDLPFSPFVAMGWVMSFITLFFALFVLVRGPAGISSADFPFGLSTVPLIVAFFVFEIPYRVLWRAPVKEEEPASNG